MQEADAGAESVLDVVIVGAGFSGLYMLYKMQQSGLRVRLYEAGQGVGGVWYWNRYPGARCDIGSLEYQFGLFEEVAREWTWTERYASQGEIRRYMDFVADRLGLRKDMQLATRVLSAHYDAGERRWNVATDKGDAVVARFCIMATGALFSARIPDIEGRNDFRGEIYHTADWPEKKVVFEGKRVAVIGTGSSGIQSIPLIAKLADHLTVFQRTANYSVPSFNHALEPETVASAHARLKDDRLKAFGTVGGSLVPVGTKSVFDVSVEEREETFERYWRAGGVLFPVSFTDILIDPKANDLAADFAQRKIRAIVQDPAIAERLIPKDLPLGTKRLCTDTNYYETYNEPHVALVDCKANPIERLTETALIAGGVEYPVDVIVFATGFDAMTGALGQIDIRGREHLTLRDKWTSGPATYLGLGVSGFPNMFFMAGPGSPSTLAVGPVASEQHGDWIDNCIRYLDEHGFATIEAKPEAEAEWSEHVNFVANQTLYPKGNSWYLGANIPGKPQLFMLYIGGFNNYMNSCNDVAENDYRGFALGLR